MSDHKDVLRAREAQAVLDNAAFQAAMASLKTSVQQQWRECPIRDVQGQVLLLQVEDSGPGVPESERELIFQPFYRALGTDADGSGLGLPIVLEIARQHSAEVFLEDAHPEQVPPGALFSVRFAARSED